MTILTIDSNTKPAIREHVEAIAGHIKDRKLLTTQEAEAKANLTKKVGELENLWPAFKAAADIGAIKFSVLDDVSQEVAFKASKCRAENTVDIVATLRQAMMIAGVTHAKIKATLESLDKAGLLSCISLSQTNMGDTLKDILKSNQTSEDTGARTYST